MKTSPSIFLTIIFGLLFIPVAFAQKHVSKITEAQLEEEIFKKVIALPEVQARIKYVDSVSRGTRQLRFSIPEESHKKNRYCWVRVLEDNGMNDYVHFNFRVDTKTLEIRYLDTINDTLIDLKAWRKRKDK